jgi:ubiquinone biosynthesis protein COQ4
MATQRGVKPRPLRPLAAMRAMRTLLADPDDTSQVFRIIRALSGNSFERLYQRVLAAPDGDRVLTQPRELLTLLQDRDALRALPEGTLGREYARFVDAERLSAEGLVEASNEELDDAHFLDERAHVLSRRMRDSHDLWHVVTGYRRDLFGEAALLAFTWAQTRNHGIGFIVLVAMLRQWKEGERDGLRLTRDGWRRGRRAAFLPAADWEALLRLPLREVRARLRIDDLPSYRPLFSAAATAH